MSTTTPGPFSDHFSQVAARYAESRPTYPPALFDWLAASCTGHALAWDCGAGSGQASIALASHFERVVATDASASQIAQATPHPRVEYRVATAERSGLADRCADLVVVAQAMHWFDPDRFHAEVRRVARADALIAAWTYGPLHVEGPAVEAIVRRFRGAMAPWWPPERRHVESGYRELAFPYERIEAPSFDIEVQWTLERLAGYFRSWSAVVRFRQAEGYDPVDAIETELRAAWPEPTRPRRIRWPLGLLAGRVA